MVVPRKPKYKTYTRGGIKYDRVELSLKYLLIRRKLEKEIVAEIEDFIAYSESQGHHIRRHGCGSGICFIYWSIKKDILKEKYNIEWHSPPELNPQVIFD